MRKIRVLFVCSRNGVHSPMAEGLLNRLDSEHFEAMSAGIERGETHPLTVKAMREIGIDVERRIPKTINDVSGLSFDFVITLCERARAECPTFPEAELVHWRFDEPFGSLGSHETRAYVSIAPRPTGPAHPFVCASPGSIN